MNRDESSVTFEDDRKKSATKQVLNIFQYWQSEELPIDILDQANTWKSNNQYTNHEVFNRNSAAEYLGQTYGATVREQFLDCRFPAMQSDIFRVGYSLNEGGVYIDAGTTCTQSIYDLCERNPGISLMKKWHGGVWNGLIIAEKGNSILEMVWNKICQNIANRKYNDVWKMTGPLCFIETLDELENDMHGLALYEQADLLKYFSIIGSAKRKENTHWSVLQKEQALFYSDD